MGDFNCKEVRWREWTAGDEESWGNVLMKLKMENLMIQWVEEAMRFRKDEEPSRLDLVLSKKPKVLENTRFKSPVGKSDHVITELLVKR